MQPLVLAAEEDAGDVLVVELGGGAGLLVEAADVLRVGGHLRRQDLQGDEAVELRVAGPEHGRHAADADRLDQLEVGQAGGRGCRRRRRWAGRAVAGPWREMIVGVSSVGGAGAERTSSGGGPTWVRREAGPAGAGWRGLLPGLSARLLSWVCMSRP